MNDGQSERFTNILLECYIIYNTICTLVVIFKMHFIAMKYTYRHPHFCCEM